MSYWSRDNTIGATDGSSFSVNSGNFIFDVGPRTTNLSYYKVDCWLDGVYFVSSQSRLSSITFQYRNKSALPLLVDVKLTAKYH